MWIGVSKSGSPTAKLMTPGCLASSKIFRMPDGGKDVTRLDRCGSNCCLLMGWIVAAGSVDRQLLGPEVYPWLPEPDALEPGSLAMVEGAIGLADQLLLALRLLREGGYTDGNGEALGQHPARGGDRGLVEDCPDDPGGHQKRLRSIRFRKDDGELIAAISRHDVHPPDGALDRRRELANRDVALWMPEQIVVLFQAVDVHHHKRDRSPVSAAAFHLQLELMLEVPVVVKTCEAVGVGQLVDLLEKGAVAQA